jgi:hypothetical protein
LAGLASEFDLIKRDEQALHRPQNEAENIVVVYPEFGMNPQQTTTKPGHTVDEALRIEGVLMLGIENLADELIKKSRDHSHMLEEEFENAENIEKLKYALVAIPFKDTQPELTTTEKHWIGGEVKGILADLSKNPGLDGDASLAELLKIDTEGCAVSKVVKEEMRGLKEMIAALEKPMVTDTRGFDAKCYNKGWEVLQTIVKNLPDNEDALFVYH